MRIIYVALRLFSQFRIIFRRKKLKETLMKQIVRRAFYERSYLCIRGISNGADRLPATTQIKFNAYYN